jgi:sodium/proline symporter
MNYYELTVFILYFVIVIGIGLYFFFKNNKGGEKDYFLGGRAISGLVAALSAGASDMSSWVLMGLPASIFAMGMGQVWIAIGLALGTILSWIFVAPRLRKFSITCGDSITIPQYLTNRFLSSSKVLQVVCAIIFLIVYAIYSASSIKACGTLFNTVMGVDANIAMFIAAAIIILYTFLGGFSAVCWTDFFQGLLMLLALMITPIIAVFFLKNHPEQIVNIDVENFWNFLPSGKFDWTSVSSILTGLGWGIGYFGMPHIIIRYMSIKSPKELKKSRIIGSIWTTLILLFAVFIALVGAKMFTQTELGDDSLIFINMVRHLFPPIISGVLLSAILAASMSTADSQLLASASAFTSDVYKPLFRKKASDKEMLWVGRGVVMAISVAALLIAINPKSGSIMDLVGNAWGLFGAAFSPAIILSLFWKKFSFKGAVASIITGGVVDALWLAFLAGKTGLYEIVPGFICGLIVGVVVSLITKPDEKVEKLFDKSLKCNK